MCSSSSIRCRPSAGSEGRAAPETSGTSEGDGILVSVSIGVAEYRPDFENPAVLVAAADRALYVAKQKGRDRVEVDAS